MNKQQKLINSKIDKIRNLSDDLFELIIWNRDFSSERKELFIPLVNKISFCADTIQITNDRKIKYMLAIEAQKEKKK